MSENTKKILIFAVISLVVFITYLGIKELGKNLDSNKTEKAINNVAEARYNANKTSVTVLLRQIEQQLLLGDLMPDSGLVIKDGKIDNSSIDVNFDFDAVLEIEKLSNQTVVNGTVTIDGSTFTIVKSKIVE